MTRHEVLKRYPRLVAHVICESLGYFCASSAAEAVKCFINREPMFCEWYSCWSPRPGEKWGDAMRRANDEVVRKAFRYRKNHRGYMADYKLACEVVRRELKGEQPLVPLAGWF